MESIQFLRDLLIVFAVAGASVFLFQKLRLPSVVGLLAAGMLVGPHSLGLIHDLENIRTLAEVGVVVLLFAVGLEFSLPRLTGMGKLMLQIGGLQVLICLVTGILATYWYFGSIHPALLVGMLLAMSSTAVVFKLLTDRGELASPQGNVAAAVLLFQDLLVVVCMVILPLLAGGSGEGGSPLVSLGLGTLVVAVLLIVGRYVVPPVLHQVARTNNRELFLISLVLVCLGSSALTASMGWSLALGAFLAGLALSESDYATQTLAEVLPFRDTLASLFFISVGMLLDLRFLALNLPLVTATVIALILLKFVAGALPTILAGYPLRLAVLAGVALAQVGEFSFILADRGLALSLLNPEQYQTFLAAAVLSVALTPAMIAAGPRLADHFARWPFPAQWHAGRGIKHASDEKVSARAHVIVVGYGLNGRNLTRVLGAVDIDYVILDLNPDTVRQARARGEPAYYGDCTRPAVLDHLGIGAARMLVIAISDPASARRAVQLARRSNPNLHIVVRTRYLSELDELRRLGATTIIPEEFETSVELFARVLRQYEVPTNLILELIDRVRSEHYELLREVKLPPMRVALPHLNVLDKLDFQSCWIREVSPLLDRTLGEVNLRAATGATLVAVRRAGKLLLNPGPDLRFQSNDVVILMGDRGQVYEAMCLCDPLLASKANGSA